MGTKGKKKSKSHGVSQGKLISCCYCGVQSAFLPDHAAHALVCSTCGAPLSTQKQRPLAEHKGAKLPPPGGAHHLPSALKGMEKPLKAKLAKYTKPKKKKKKSLLGLLVDVVEEVFD